MPGKNPQIKEKTSNGANQGADSGAFEENWGIHNIK